MSDSLKTDRHVIDGKIWAAIEELKLDQAVRQQKLEGFVDNQKGRNAEILTAIKDTNAQILAMRNETATHNEKEAQINASYVRKGAWFLGALVVGLVGYIWQITVGKLP